MYLDKYPVKSQPDKKRFEFVSEGPKGEILKVVLFEQVGRNAYNIAFGDWDSMNETFHTRVRSNNGDRDKVLATVASVVAEFMESNADARIFAVGETVAKTRLYQMGINRHLKEISMLYKIEGWNGYRWEDFDTRKNYSAFRLKT